MKNWRIIPILSDESLSAAESHWEDFTLRNVLEEHWNVYIHPSTFTVLKKKDPEVLGYYILQSFRFFPLHLDSKFPSFSYLLPAVITH